MARSRLAQRGAGGACRALGVTQRMTAHRGGEVDLDGPWRRGDPTGARLPANPASVARPTPAHIAIARHRTLNHYGETLNTVP
jgi:hypothetical protein